MRDEPMRVTKRANIANHSGVSDVADASSVDKPRYRCRLSAANAFRLLAVSVLALGLANCSSAPRSGGKIAASAKVDPKYGVKPSPRVVKSGGKVPKGGGRDMVGKPYVVAGRQFTPKESEDYVAVGTASWYGSQFHGRKTANGEVFDKYSFAAAHPTLPLPSYVRVTNLTNKRSMIVRVNDRGPFHGNRLIDLSKGAAEALDFHRQGTARVKVEYMGRASLNGSDDRKLLATLNADAPAAVPAVAPVPAAMPAPAPVMVASVDPQPAVAPAPAEIAPVASPLADTASPGLTEQTLVAAPGEPEAPAVANQTPVAPVEPQPVVAQPVVSPSRTLVAPPQTLAFTDQSHPLPTPPAAATSQLTELVQEVAAPLPPVRPTDLARRRTLIASPGASEALQGGSVATSGRRALVADLAAPGAETSARRDRLGLSSDMGLQLPPQRFLAFGGSEAGRVTNGH